jgi:hypothetical protein
MEPFLPDGCGWQHRVTQLDTSSGIRQLPRIRHRRPSCRTPLLSAGYDARARLQRTLLSRPTPRRSTPIVTTGLHFRHAQESRTQRGPRGGGGQIAVKVMAPDGSRPVPIGGEPSKPREG